MTDTPKDNQSEISDTEKKALSMVDDKGDSSQENPKENKDSNDDTNQNDQKDTASSDDAPFFLEDEVKEKRSPLWWFILALFLILGLLLAGYIYNIFGMRDKAIGYSFDYNPFDNTQKSQILPLEDAQKNSKKNPKATAKNSPTLPKASKELNQTPLLGTENNIDQKSKSLNDNSPISENKSDSRQDNEQASIVNNSKGDQEIKDDSIQIVDLSQEPLVPSEPYGLTQQEFKAHRQAIRQLKMDIYRQTPFIDSFLNVKQLFPTLDLKRMKKYMATGFYTKNMIAREGMKAIKNAATSGEIMLNKDHVQDSLTGILSKFLVVTSHQQDIHDPFSQLKQHLESYHFKQALEIIENMPENQQLYFAGVKEYMQDHYLIKQELSMLEQGLDKKLFPTEKNI